MRCGYCSREFDNAKSLSNHVRWHDLPQYQEYQKSYKINAKLINHSEKNGNWLGDNVSKRGLHRWVTRQKGKPEKCEECGEEKQLDLANISQEYKRDLDDWEWLCRRCHMKKDGRLEILIQNNKEAKYH